MEEKIVVITGASSGIGKSTAELFAKNGYTVFDLSRHSSGSSAFIHFDADVTKPETLSSAYNRIFEKHSKIDVLITCAGFGVSGASEFIPYSEIKKQFDVNLFGTINAVNAVLPFMRKAKSGRIICISSVAAIYSIPFQSYYSASKAAINSFVDALSNEVGPFGISVCSVMPGDISTAFTDARQKTSAGSEIYTSVSSAVAAMEKDERGGMSPESVARLVLKLAEKKKVAPLYTVGSSYKALVFLKRIFPHSLAVKIVGKMYR